MDYSSPKLEDPNVAVGMTVQSDNMADPMMQ